MFVNEQVREYGMSEATGLLSFQDDKNSIKPYSKKMAALFDDEVRRVVAKAHQTTEKVIIENKDKLELVCIFNSYCYYNILYIYTLINAVNSQFI